MLNGLSKVTVFHIIKLRFPSLPKTADSLPTTTLTLLPKVSTSSTSFMHLFYLRGRKRHEREKEIPMADSYCNCPQQLGLGQDQSWELETCGGPELIHSSPHWVLPRVCIIGKLESRAAGAN